MEESKGIKINTKAIKRFNEYELCESFLPKGAKIIEKLGNNWFKWTFENNTFLSHYWTDGHRGSINHCKL